MTSLKSYLVSLWQSADHWHRGTIRSGPERPLSPSEPPTSIPNLTDRIFRQGDGQPCEASGFCDAFRCLYTSNDSIKEVAVKAFRFGFFIDDLEHKRDGKKRIRGELEIWRRLSHRNIVQFLGVAYGFGRQGSVSLVSMWMPHGTLHTFLQAHDDRLAVAHRLQLLLDVANGLHYLHSFQITHGNLSSTNVLLDNNYTACLADFGCASLIGELPEGLNYLKTSTVGQGTRRWAAPERFAFNEQKLTRTIRSDIYSFGNMALFILSGRLPWSEVSTDEAIVVCMFRGLNPGRPHQRPIDDRHWALIERCWLPVPERPPAEDIISFLQRFFGACAPLPPLRDSLVPTSFSVPNRPGNDDLDDDVARSRTGSQESPTSSFMSPPPEIVRRPSPHDIYATKRSMSSDLPSSVISGNEPVNPSTSNVALVKTPVNRWAAPIPIHGPGATDTESPELVDREVKALLNKLTMEKFDSISDQIIAWANVSVNETTGWTLIQVIRLIFKKASDEAEWSEMYAHLCRRMMEAISPEVQDIGIQTSEGRPIAGDRLFKKYLLDRCRENFGRDWVAKETTVKASDDQTMKKKRGDESKLYPDEYHAGQKEKFGLIKFIGDLFKLQLLTESIMHQCIKRLLPNVGNPEEEEVKSLCQLLETAGRLLDVPKARAHMDMYIVRMKELCKDPNVSPTMRSILQNVIDLRDRKWGSIRSSRMSKASTPSANIPVQLPSQSAWAKGANSTSSVPSPRSQSPALSHAPSPIITSHSRRPSALGHGVPIKVGVSAPRSDVGSVRQGQHTSIHLRPSLPPLAFVPGSAVTLGSIDNISPPLPSSPAVTPVVKIESVKSFGSVPATPSTRVSGKHPASLSTAGSSKFPARLASTSSNVTPLSTTPATSSSTTSASTKPALGKANIAKLFQGSSSTSSQPSSDTSSPSTRPSNLPPHQLSSSGQHPPQPPAQPSQLGAHQYAPFVPGMRPQQGAGGPRSPAFSRAVPNGTGAPPRPMAGPGGPGAPPIPASPRLAPHPPHPHQPLPTGVPAQQVPMRAMPWAPYYYPVDAYGQPVSATWFYPHHMHQQPHPPHTPHPPAPAAQGPPHPATLPSPRNPPPSLPPGTPTLTRAVPHPPHTPQPPTSHTHQPSNSMSISSPPPTPSTTTGPSARAFNANASTFVPTSRAPKVIVIKNKDGTELSLEALKKQYNPQPPTVPIPLPSPATTSRRTASVRIESEESRRNREQRARLEQERKDAEERAKKEGEERKRKEEEAQTYQRQISMSRGGSKRGGDRNVESGPDSWTIAGGSVARPQLKAGDLSRFGKISKAAPMVMGPSSVFTKKDPKRDSLSRTSSSSNMFSMLSQNPELVVDTTAKPSRPPSRQPSVDLGQVGPPEPPLQRKKLRLLPRSKHTPTKETPPPAPEEEPEPPAGMSEADAKKIDEDVKEFFAVRSMEEADVYFTNLPEEHRFLLVDKLVASALESKEADAVLVADFFAQAAPKGQCSPEVLEAGFTPTVELLDDIVIDAPNAFKFMAIMLKGAGFDEDEERLVRLAGKSMDSDKLLQLVSS